MTIAKLSRTKNNGHNTSLVIISTSLAKLAWEVFRDGATASAVIQFLTDQSNLGQCFSHFNNGFAS